MINFILVVFFVTRCDGKLFTVWFVFQLAENYSKLNEENWLINSSGLNKNQKYSKTLHFLPAGVWNLNSDKEDKVLEKKLAAKKLEKLEKSIRWNLPDKKWNAFCSVRTNVFNCQFLFNTCQHYDDIRKYLEICKKEV